MKIGYLGAGTWGFCLASLLSGKGYRVVLWTSKPAFAEQLKKTREHPKLPGVKASGDITFTSELSEALEGSDLLVESVTAMGLRPVLEKVKEVKTVHCPFIITSKGIEQNTLLLLPEVVYHVLGEAMKPNVGCLSGPSHAEEVIHHLPTSVVCSAFDPAKTSLILEAFSTPYFRIYPNADIHGVAFGGAMKNVISIACGISDELGFGDNTKAALLTRGLHEMRKLSVTKGCNPETLNGLSGLGDLCVTCLSTLSRNYRFGRLIAKGLSSESAKETIGMVVEGVYSCLSAVQLGQKARIAVPISQAVHSILYEGLNPKDAVKSLLQRTIKEEHL
jgi:glycerol-3-phosphate dehydrogenase (NAD(P)+)